MVLGCGFAGYSLVSNLPRRSFDVTVVSPRNYFLFTPLLPSAVSGGVELRSILEPVRRRLPSVRLLEGAAVEADLERRTVRCQAVGSGTPFSVAYDRLVIAVGAAVADYGVPGVHEHALTLRSAEDGRRIRHRLLSQFAAANLPGIEEPEVRRLLTFVVCGGGPTGVEVAAEIHDLLRRELRRLHPRLVGLARVVLLEAADRLLTSFDEALSEHAQHHFAREGVEVRISTPVRAIEERRVLLGGGGELGSGLVVWAGGNAPRSFVSRVGVPLDSGRIPVDGHLRVPALESVWAVGDCAAAGAPPMPATAQVAQRQGAYLARSFRRERRGRAVAPFDHRSLGMLAYIGAGRALADLPGVKWSGRAAWWLWKSVYFTKLVSLANKIKVLFDWVKARLLGRDLSRI